MDGLAFDIECGDARGSEDYHSLAGIAAEVVQQGGFARAGPAGNEGAFGVFSIISRACLNCSFISMTKGSGFSLGI